VRHRYVIAHLHAAIRTYTSTHTLAYAHTQAYIDAHTGIHTSTHTHSHTQKLGGRTGLSRSKTGGSAGYNIICDIPGACVCV